MQNERFTGLTDIEVIASRKAHGENVLTPPEKAPWWKEFLEKFTDPIIVILLVALFLSVAVACFEYLSGQARVSVFLEPLGILTAVLLATIVGFCFEQNANRKFEVLNQVNDDTLVNVIRNSKVGQIAKRNVVVGDIVLLETGEEVPADGELLEAVSLQVNESTLTGEPVCRKSVNPSDFDKEATYPSNHIMKGTTVQDGHGVMRVFKVGDATEYGKVYEGAQIEDSVEKPLQQQLNGLANVITKGSYLIAILIVTGRLLSFTFTNIRSFTWGGFLPWFFGAVLLAVAVFQGIRKTNLEQKSDFLKYLFSIVVLILGFTAYYIFDVDSGEINLEQFSSYALQTVMIAVTVIVVAVPEGLPMSVTLSLALSMKRMLSANNLVRKMHACETMGAATVICTDKTGTLTQNQMKVYETRFTEAANVVRDCFVPRNDDHEGDCFVPRNDETRIVVPPLIAEGIAANTTAYLEITAQDNIQTLGNPTEGALLLWLHDNGIDYLPLRENAKVIEQLTFSTERKYMATLVQSPLFGKKVIYVKGAPEIVLGMCNDFASASEKAEVEAGLLEYQSKAMRTLGFAYKIVEDGLTDARSGQPVPVKKDNGCNTHIICDALTREGEDASAAPVANNDKLTFLGFVAISDPVRQDVPAAVASCIAAGIDIKIVTGDTSATAIEIGRQIGLWKDNEPSSHHITGAEFAEADDDNLLERVEEIKIMSRARPMDKQRLVQLLQKRGEVVAVTGDGTNDAPALNAAQVGLSVGDGTFVAKEASDITIIDNSFNSISRAVMWGRSLYQNIQRFILFQMTINIAACIIVLTGAFIGTESPLTVTQMLWVNLIMDTFAALALASLPPNEGVMKDKPRKTTDFIISQPMWARILSIGLLFVLVMFGFLQYFRHFNIEALNQFNISDFCSGYFNFRGGSELTSYELSLFFTLFVLLQFWNMFNAKALKSGKSAFANMSNSSGFMLIAAVILAGQWLIVTTGGEMFNVVPLSAQDWGLIIGGTSIVLWAGEALRLIRKYI